MKSGCFKYFFKCLWFQFFLISLINAEFDEDMWMDPDAWSRDHLATGDFQFPNGKCCKCTDVPINHENTQHPFRELTETTAEDSASSIYFKKFVTMLFNRKNFKYDSTQQHYKRTVVFTLTLDQMDKLEKLQDPRDLDNILVDVLNNIRTSSMNYEGQQEFHIREISTTIKTIIYNILYDMWQLMKVSEVRFLLVAMIVILTAWFIHTRYKIGWLLLISGGVFIFGYLHTYIECNRELEGNQLLEILNIDTGNKNNVKGFTFFKFFKGMFYSDDVETLQKQRIKQSAKISLGFCRPDHVFIMYLNDITLKYLQVLIEQCTVTISSLSGNLGFPYNMLAPVILVCLIGYILKLIFKYILTPSAWSQLLHRRQIYIKDETTLKSVSNSDDDRISGENLKLLLNAINAVPQRNAVAPEFQNSMAVSGVEDVREAIESNLEKTSPKLNKSTSENSQNNNVSNKKSSDDKLDLKIEDLSECL